MNKSIINKIKTSPKLPGVYIFSNQKEVVYVGKASNINQRLKSYLDDKQSKNQTISKYAKNLSWQITQNDIEALILESKLIKKHQPRVNVIFKDNKNYFFVNITNDLFPKVLITHNQQVKNGTIIGPFTSGTHLKALLKLLQPIFPFCTCKTNHKKPCMNNQLKLCPGYCCIQNQTFTKTDRIIYLNNIKNLKNFFTFKNQAFLKTLYSQIDKLIKNQEFERANIVKQQILAVNNIAKHTKFINTCDDKFKESLDELSKIFQAISPIRHIEMYDVSNISGQFATASLVFFSDGSPNKKAYKKFKIRYTQLLPNDVLMLKEIFKRRTNNIY
jgi:excinuclease ABC subunit C